MTDGASISAKEWRDRKCTTEVLGHSMAHVEMGQGAPILFLHGNPTSSFLWRDVMAGMDGTGRRLAPDLIGMGDSDKLPNSGPGRYTLAEHARFLDVWFETVVPKGLVTLVLHDWGGPLGIRWARRNPARVRGIAYMETLLRPMLLEEWPEGIRDLFSALRSSAGEEMILEKNVFVERILPESILRKLTSEELDEYRRPFLDVGEGRRPTLTWPRQIPLGGEPTDSIEIIAANYEWLRQADVPKLLVTADPGAILQGAVLDDARALSNQTEAEVAGIHFLQEDSGAEIARALHNWMAGFS